MTRVENDRDRELIDKEVVVGVQRGFMSNKEKINRREFLLATSAAAVGATAFQGAKVSEAQGPSSFQSKAGSLVPYLCSELLSGKSATAPLSGPQLAEVAFPLGGIGTGTVSLGGHFGAADSAQKRDRRGGFVGLGRGRFGLESGVEGSERIKWRDGADQI